MALTELIFGSPKKAQIGLVQLDASVTESHTKQSQITEFPVEAGANITDHIRRQPEEISITGIVTNTPVILAASLNPPSPIEGDLTSVAERAELAFAEMRRSMDAGELVSVSTTLRDYDNMAIRSLAVERNAAKGNIVEMVVGLREVILASTKEVELATEVATVRQPGQNIEDTGKKPPKPPPAPVDAAATESSLLFSFLGG